MDERARDIYVQMLGGEDLPDELIAVYDLAKLIHDRVMSGAPFSTEVLACLAMIAGVKKDLSAVRQAADSQLPIEKNVGAGEFSAGQMVKLNWHGKTRQAKFVSYHKDGKTAIVLFEGEKTARRIACSRLRKVGKNG